MELTERKLLARELASRVATIGFKSSAQKATIRLSDDWEGLIFFDWSSQGRVYSVAPIIAIRCVSLEKQLNNLKSVVNKTIDVSYWRTLASLFPVSRPFDWEFTSVDEAMLGDVVNGIHQYGLPFMRDGASLKNLAALLSEEDPATVKAKLRQPLANFNSGNRLEAVLSVKKQLDEIPSHRLVGSPLIQELEAGYTELLNYFFFVDPNLSSRTKKTEQALEEPLGRHDHTENSTKNTVGDNLFVAAVYFDPQGRSFVTWTYGVETLLPKAETVVFNKPPDADSPLGALDLPYRHLLQVTWEDFERVCGPLKPDPNSADEKSLMTKFPSDQQFKKLKKTAISELWTPAEIDDLKMPRKLEVRGAHSTAKFEFVPDQKNAMFGGFDILVQCNSSGVSYSEIRSTLDVNLLPFVQALESMNRDLAGEASLGMEYLTLDVEMLRRGRVSWRLNVSSMLDGGDRWTLDVIINSDQTSLPDAIKFFSQTPGLDVSRR